jgi:putative flippase GtrA
VQLGTLAVLTHGAGLPAAAAAAIAVEIAVLHNFVWHERWTWRDRTGGGRAGVFARLARFHAAAGMVSLAGNVGITLTLIEWLHLPVLIANTVAVTALGVLNFVIADGYVFESGTRPACGTRTSGLR